MTIAYVLCGGNSLPNVAPATVLHDDYHAAALSVGPQIEAAGHTRLFYHNPGGNYYLGWTPDPANPANTTQINAATALGVDTREMHVNQWLLAEQSGCSFADRNKLKLGHQLLRSDYGITEVIYYVGGPNVLWDIWRDGPAALEMFMACGEGVSFGFDYCAWDGNPIQAGDETCKFFEYLRRRGHKVYVEPRLNAAQVAAGYGLYVDGTVASETFDTTFSPNLSIQPGETIRGPLAPATAVPGGVTGMYHDGAGSNWA